MIDHTAKSQHLQSKASQRIKQIESSQYTARPETPAHSPKRQYSTDSVNNFKLRSVSEDDDNSINRAIQHANVPLSTLLGVSILGGIVSTASMVLGYVLVKNAVKSQRNHNHSSVQTQTPSIQYTGTTMR